jgi:hypothetical protein
MKRLLLIIAFLGLISSAFADAPFFIQIGGGYSFISYPADLADTISEVESYPGVSRIPLALDVAGGISIAPDSFLMLRLDCTGDRLSYGTNWVQINSYLYSIGVRHYWRRFFVDGALGMARIVTQLNSVSDYSLSDPGFGIGGGVGYDFAGNQQRFGAILEAHGDALYIDGDNVSNISLLFDLCVK